MMYLIGFIFAAALLSAPVTLALLFQHRFIYFPRHYSAAELQEARNAGVQSLQFQTSQGNQVAFFWQKDDSRTVSRNVWMIFGGNGSVALDWIGLVRQFSTSGVCFLLIDYPGYGICEGRPNPQSILENSEGALQALKEYRHWEIDAEALGILGHSLGGAAALLFAAKHVVREIVIFSTLTTMEEMVRTQIHFPLGPLLRHRFDNLSSLRTILSQDPVPRICIFHGDADEIVPLKMGHALAQLDPRRITFIEIPGAGHNEIVEIALPRGLQLDP